MNFLMLQFLDEERIKQTRRLERESGIFLDKSYLAELVIKGEWENLENYLSGFMISLIWKQIYLEALEKGDHAKTVELLQSDPNVLSSSQYKGMAWLWAAKNFRYYKLLVLHLLCRNFSPLIQENALNGRTEEKYQNSENVRHSVSKNIESRGASLLPGLEKLILNNFILNDKLQFPALENSILKILMIQSLNCQRHFCIDQKSSPATKSLFVDDTFGEPTSSNPPPNFVSPLKRPRNHLRVSDANANSGLQASHLIRFKILVNSQGHRLFDRIEIHPLPPGKPGTAVASGSETRSRSGSDSSKSNTPIASQTERSNTNLRNQEADKKEVWMFTEIREPAQLCSLKLSDNMLPVRIACLTYTHAGISILALTYNAVHKLWKWERNERATTAAPAQLWLSSRGVLMTNDISDSNLAEAVPCFSFSDNDEYLVSASGGKVSLYSMLTFKMMTSFRTPPPAATAIAFHPRDNNVMAIGLDDSSIHIYYIQMDEVKAKLQGHPTRVTSLAFSDVLNVLVSSSHSQLCVWDLDSWERKRCVHMISPLGLDLDPSTRTKVQFCRDRIHLLLVHEMQIAIYKAPDLELIKQGTLSGSVTKIADATYSCDGDSILTSFTDGRLSIFTAPELNLKCRIYPSAYLPTNLSSRIYALVVAAHPSKPQQFALGLKNGKVHVIEPLENEEEWVNERSTGIWMSSTKITVSLE